jgi:hypothetical protein
VIVTEEVTEVVPDREAVLEGVPVIVCVAVPERVPVLVDVWDAV